MGLDYFLAATREKLFLKNLAIKYQLGKIEPPVAITWEATKKCNLNCKHCGVERGKEKELDNCRVKEVIEELAKMRVKYFQITGGEPLLRKGLFEILRYAAKKGIKTTMATNGFFIEKETARKLKKAKIALVQISIDGTEKTHNQIRGNKKSYAKAMQAMEVLKKEKIPIAVATCVMPENIGELEELKKILIAKKTGFWILGVTMPTGKAKKNKELFLSKQQFRELLEFMVNSKKQINLDLGENFPYLGKFDEKIRKKPKTCLAGILGCCIGATGHVRACPDMPDTKENREGNLLKEKFQEIWKKSFREERERIVKSNDKKCADCKEWGNCHGGCKVMRIENRHCFLKYLE